MGDNVEYDEDVPDFAIIDNNFNRNSEGPQFVKKVESVEVYGYKAPDGFE